MRSTRARSRCEAPGDAQALQTDQLLYIYTAMKKFPFPVDRAGRYLLPKLTARQLHELMRAEPSDEVVRRLGWEVYRLRRLVVRGNQLQESIGAGCYASTLFIRDCFREELAGEPCIEEHKAATGAVFGHRAGQGQ